MNILLKQKSVHSLSRMKLNVSGSLILFMLSLLLQESFGLAIENTKQEWETLMVKFKASCWRSHSLNCTKPRYFFSKFPRQLITIIQMFTLPRAYSTTQSKQRLVSSWCEPFLAPCFHDWEYLQLSQALARLTTILVFYCLRLPSRTTDSW